MGRSLTDGLVARLRTDKEPNHSEEEVPLSPECADEGNRPTRSSPSLACLKVRDPLFASFMNSGVEWRAGINRELKGMALLTVAPFGTGRYWKR